MIKRIEILYIKLGTWARGSTYENAPITPFDNGEVLFDRRYDKGTKTQKVWTDIRSAMAKYFFATFFPSVIWKTGIADRPLKTKSHEWVKKRTPEGLMRWITPELDRKMSEEPDAYTWNKTFKKWHMESNAYVEKTLEQGGAIDIAVGTKEDEFYDWTFLDDMQSKVDREKPENRTFDIILFVYPDKYDEEIRSMFQLRITFW